jgi:uncharacterized protein involved in outer membrane biogenesis
MRLSLTRHAVVIAEDIRFQNAEWGDEPYMVEIGRAEVHVDLRSIFNGPLLIELIDVDDVEIRLVKPEDGDPNWKVSLQSAAPSRAEEESEAGFEVLFDVIDIDSFLSRQISISHSTFASNILISDIETTVFSSSICRQRLVAVSLALPVSWAPGRPCW